MKRFALALAIAMQCSAATAETPSSPPAAADDVLVTVDGMAITQNHFIAMAQLEGIGQQDLETAQQQTAMMNSLINSVLLAKAAEKAGLDQDKHIQAALDLSRVQVLAQAQLGSYANANPPTIAEVQAQYDKKYSPERLREYKASHILSETKEGAEAALAELNAGKPFAEVAKAQSKDPSAAQGGDLGWFTRAQVIKSFGDAVAALEKGSFTKEPVQTRFGWHIILLEDQRDQAAPELASVQDEIKSEVTQQKILAYLNELRATATVEVNEPEPKAEAEVEQKPAQ